MKGRTSLKRDKAIKFRIRALRILAQVAIDWDNVLPADAEAKAWKLVNGTPIGKLEQIVDQAIARDKLLRASREAALAAAARIDETLVALLIEPLVNPAIEIEKIFAES